MSQEFKQRYSEMREGDPTASIKISGTVSENLDYYVQPGSFRNVGFIWPNGNRLFLSYAYLVGAEYTINDATNHLILHFTSYKVNIEGYRLKELYLLLMEQRVKTISVIDERYLIDESRVDGTVIQLTVKVLS